MTTEDERIYSNSHINKRSFGLSSSSNHLFKEFLRAVSHVTEMGKKKSPFPKHMSDIDKSFFKLKAYRKIYGIDEKSLSCTMKLCELSPKEDLFSFSPVLNEFHDYMSLSINESGISFEQFSKMPKIYKDELIEIFKQKATTKVNSVPKDLLELMKNK